MLCITLGVMMNFIGRDNITYLLIGFAFAFALLIFSWLLTRNVRKNQAGTLILNIGRLSTSKIYVQIGLLNALSAGFQGCLAIYLISIGPTLFDRVQTILSAISQAILYSSLATYFTLLGLSRFEFRENGIYYMLSFSEWEKLESYTWNAAKPNSLTITMKKPRFFLSPKFWSVEIPSQHRDTVEQIMSERLIRI